MGAALNAFHPTWSAAALSLLMGLIVAGVPAVAVSSPDAAASEVHIAAESSGEVEASPSLAEVPPGVDEPGVPATAPARPSGPAARFLAEAAGGSLLVRLPLACVPSDEEALAGLRRIMAAEMAAQPWRRRPPTEPPPALPDARAVNGWLAGAHGQAFEAALRALHAVDPEAAPWLAGVVEGPLPADDRCRVGEIAELAELWSLAPAAVLPREFEVRHLLHSGPLPVEPAWRMVLHHYVQGTEDVVRWVAGTRDDGPDRTAMLALADALSPVRDGTRLALRLQPEEGDARESLHQWAKLEVMRREGQAAEVAGRLAALVDADPMFVHAGLSAVAALREAGQRGAALEIASHLRGLGVEDAVLQRHLEAMSESLGR